MNCPRCNRPIDAHVAGRETDACVAEVVMGWKRGPVFINNIEYEVLHSPTNFDEMDNYPRYSTSIADAWEVVEHITNMQLPKHIGPTMLHRLRQCGPRGWGVIWCSDFGYTEEVFGPTPELAICLAALKACAA